jgi:hypothetical protein
MFWLCPTFFHDAVPLVLEVIGFVGTETFIADFFLHVFFVFAIGIACRWFLTFIKYLPKKDPERINIRVRICFMLV